jgi:hypothetical protein
MPLMKALVCSEPGKLAIEERKVPSVSAEMVMVRPRRVGI